MSFKSLSVLVALAVQLCGCSGDEATPGGASGAAGSAGTTAQAGAGAGGVGGAGASSGGAGAIAGGGVAGALAGAGGSAGASGGSAGASPGNAFAGTAQLMVLGSSNELATCWRALLWQKLQTAELTDFDFVGDVTQGPDCGVPGYDKDLRATSGTIVTNLTAEQFAGWFTAHPADAMLVHFGGADLLNNMPVAGVVEGYDRMLAEARKVRSSVRILMGQHTPQDSASCDDCENTVKELNAAIVTWAETNATPESPIVVVDLFTGVDPATDTDDGIHLNMAGSMKVADRFFAALSPYFGK